MKRKLITLSIVSLCSLCPVYGQGLPVHTEQKPGTPPELPDHPEHIEKIAPTINIPEPLFQHREDFAKAKDKKTGEANSATDDNKGSKGDKTSLEESDTANKKVSFEGPKDEGKLLEDENISKQWRNLIKQGDEAIKVGKFSSATSKFKKALSFLSKEENKDILEAITYKRLGMGYTGRKQFMEAVDNLKQATILYRKLGIADQGLNDAYQNLGQWYKELDFHKFGDKVAKYFEEAKVEKISVVKDPENTKVEVLLADKLIRDLKSEKVKKVRFDKTVSFNFKALPDSKYGLDHVSGLQVKTTKIWVNLLSSIMGMNPNNEPEALVTGGKLGKEKTVKIKVPDKIYDQSMSILEEFKTAINSTKYDANLFSAAQAAEQHEGDNSNSNQTDSQEPLTSGTTDPGSLYPGTGRKDSKLNDRRLSPPEVINTLHSPVEPGSLNTPHSQYSEVLDNHLPTEKPQTRYP